MDQTSLRQKVMNLVNRFAALRNQKTFLLILLILIPVSMEAWNLLHVWMAVNEAAHSGVRYAVAQNYNKNYCPEPCESDAEREEARLRSTYQEIHDQLLQVVRVNDLSSGNLDITVCSDLPGYHYSKAANTCIPHDSVGEGGSQVVVGVVYNYSLGSSLGAKITPVKMRAEREGIGEVFRTARVTIIPGNDEKMVVVTGNVQLTIDNVENVVNEIARLVDESGGYVVESVVGDNDGQRYANIKIRIPVEGFENVLEQVEGLANKTLEENITRRDVTEEYVDMDSNLRGLQATYDQLNKLLSQAETVDEALNVAVEQGKIQEQIEQTTGKMKYLENQVALASLDISLSVENSELIQNDASWRGGETFRNAINFLISSVYFTGDILIWLLVVGIPLSVVVWVVKKIINRLWRRNHPRV
jgi:hypothetical protein